MVTTDELRKTPGRKRPRAKGGKNHAWTVPELKRLSEVYKFMTRDELAAAFPRHPIGSIIATARKKLGLSRGTPLQRSARLLKVAQAHVPKAFDPRKGYL
jgi:hypothetical protein